MESKANEDIKRQQEYDEWLRKEVEEAILDPRPSLSHKEVIALMNDYLEKHNKTE